MKNVRIAENFVKEIRKSDPDNREIRLDEVAILNDKQKIPVRQEKPVEALESLARALDLAKECYQFDAMNIEAISWIGHLSQEAANILSKQGKEKDAEKHR